MTTSKQGTTTGKPAGLKLDSPQIQQYDVIIGWDSEYRNKEYLLDLEELQIEKNASLSESERNNLFDLLDKKRTGNCRYNDVISYQYAAYSFVNDTYKENIIYLYDKKSKKFKKRWRLNQIIAHVLKSLGMSWSDCNPKARQKNRKLRILLVSHFSVAEFSTLHKREELHDKLSEVQSTLTSFESFNQSIQWDKDRNYFDVSVSGKDTTLLSGEGEKSLDSISQVVGMPKLHLEKKDYLNMISLLEKQDINDNLFEKYAIEDAKIALAYYCSFMSDFYEITDKYKVDVEPTTTAGASVLFFRKYLEEKSLVTNENKKKDKKFIENKLLGKERNWKGKIVKSKERLFDESFAGNAYAGGLNNYYKIGKYKCKKDEIILDIDFSGAYTGAMAILPAIDYQLREENSFMDWIYLAKALGDFSSIDYTKVGIFLTEFNFSESGVYQSAIPKGEEEGLIYSNKGSEYCTGPELIEAIMQKGITDNKQVIKGTIYKELMVNGEVFLPFAEFLGYIMRKEEALAKSSPQRRVLKLMRNGFYGKIAQGIKYREVYDLDGKKVPLDESAITDPRYASQITGIIRTALVKMINVISEGPGCQVFNATTDGLTISIPKPANLAIKVDEKGIATIEKSFQELMPALYEYLIQQLPIKLLIKGKQNLGTKNQSGIEIKAVGDETRTEQTRANYITYHGITQAIARGNVSREVMTDAATFDRFADDKEVTEIRVRKLSGLREIKGKERGDLTNKRQLDKKTGVGKYLRKKVNIGYDGKREPINIGEKLVETRQHETHDHGAEGRLAVDKVKEQGIRATLENILFRKEARNGIASLGLQGGLEKTIARTFVITSGKYGGQRNKIKNIKLVEQLNQILGQEENLISETDLKNGKRKDNFRTDKLLPDILQVKNIISKISFCGGIKLDEEKGNKLVIGND